jgi:hypothetical protein
VAQGVALEFKPQYHKRKKERKKERLVKIGSKWNDLRSFMRIT